MSDSALTHWQRASGMHDRRHPNDIGVNVEHRYLRQSLDHQLTRARIGLTRPGALSVRLRRHDVWVDAPVDTPGVEYIATISDEFNGLLNVERRVIGQFNSHVAKQLSGEIRKSALEVDLYPCERFRVGT
jgi:hypothetical protein